MKLLIKVAILVVLVVSYFVINMHDQVYAQTSCPARDICLDTAYDNYVNGVALANQEYLSCEQDAAGTREGCFGDAAQGFTYCEFEANLVFENNLARCSTIPDPYQAEYCVQELETLRHEVLSMCYGIYDSANQECHLNYSYDVQVCQQTVFFPLVQIAQLIWDIERAACDQLCD